MSMHRTSFFTPPVTLDVREKRITKRDGVTEKIISCAPWMGSALEKSGLSVLHSRSSYDHIQDGIQWFKRADL
jgi:hypothetical protein